MGFSRPKPPKPDNRLIELQLKQQREAEEARKKAEAEAAEEKQKQEDLARRRRLGRSSLLGTEGEELGVM